MSKQPDDLGRGSYAEMVEQQRPASSRGTVTQNGSTAHNRRLLIWGIVVLCILLLIILFVKFVWPIIFGFFCLAAALTIVGNVISDK
jgi:uncharacterized membrane protein